MSTKSEHEVEILCAKDHGYILGGKFQATARLNLQHYLWQEAVNFIVHPSITLPSKPAVAEVAVGTGMWATAAARELPGSQIEVFDTDLASLSHKKWLPSGISAQHWNILEDPPEELVGKFDFVHTRLIFLILTRIDPRPVVERLLRLLKPGGWLQWEEYDLGNLRIVAADGSVDASGHRRLLENFHMQNMHDWVLEIPQMLAQLGATNVGMHRYASPEAFHRAFTDITCMTTMELVDTMHSVGRSEDAKKLSSLIDLVYEESLKGVAFDYPRVVCVAQKHE